VHLILIWFQSGRDKEGLLRLFDRKRLDGTVNSYGTPVTVFFNETEWKWAGFELRG